MVRRVRGEDPEVRWRVVLLVLVDVMNDFSYAERTT